MAARHIALDYASRHSKFHSTDPPATSPEICLEVSAHTHITYLRTLDPLS